MIDHSYGKLYTIQRFPRQRLLYPMNLSDILKDSEYKLSQFKPDEVAWLEQTIFLKTSTKGDVPYIKCLVRGKDIKLTPEEAVRQLYLNVLTGRYQYPANRILVEYEVSFGREKKRADIAIMDRDRPNVPYIIVELKKPKLKDGKEQLKSYCNATGSPIGVWTNGEQISFYQRKDPNYFEDITDIPNVNQTLADILNERFTLNDLVKKDKLVTEKKSLKALILEMEDEVLANAGVDVFEELFMLIFTKLYDEWESGRDEKRKNTRLLEFRNTGQTETELKIKIQGLFDRAKKQWEGVFKESDKITLSLSHLSICVSSLENVKLFNSNLDVVDEAFEYLISKSSKGEKGQYFTPRYVIDMCVKMLNPQEDEAIIDTAAGSSGFPVHTIFYVWQRIIDDEGLQVSNLFSLEKKPVRCEDYVKGKVFAIDFDEKAVRVSRTLNLIAGDGQTNVLHLNTLDYGSWKERAKEDDWRDVYGDGFKRLRGFADKKDDFKSFQFDIVMANPPFAGEIKESQTISKYDLAVKGNGKRQEKMGRDILFIERNLDFLKAGGRMAVVLPQGRFNNSSDKYIRDFIAERCRILAVVGLHGNTFKPHTGTKTSVLFVQKWNDDPRAGALCPRRDNYNIFFATMRKSGKDNSGDKIYVKKSDGSGEFLLDAHGHLIVDHDLFNHDGKTQDGIAEAFIEFTKKENLSFFDLSSSVTPFDAEKYDRLMGELEASEVRYSDLERTHRIDSEFFKKEYIEITRILKQKRLNSITNLVKVFDGNHMKISDNFTDNGIPYYRGQDIHHFFIEQSSPIFIDEDTYNLSYMKRSHLKKGDVLLSIVGTIGSVSFVSTNQPATCNCKLAILRPQKVKPEYFSTYLNSKFGQSQIKRFTRGAVQMGLILEDMDQVIIPEFSSKIEESVSDVIMLAEKCLRQSDKRYQQAEDLLLSELGLKDWQPTDENIAVKSFSASFGTSDRLDAEHYQPKFDQLIEKIEQKVNLSKLGELLTWNQRGKQPSYFEEDQNILDGLPVVNSKHVREGQVILVDNRYAKYQPEDKPLIIQTNDVLINGTGVGTIGRCAPYLHKQNALPDNHVTILRTKVLDPVYLSIYINSIAGQYQVEKYLKGSSGQTELYPKDIDNFWVWEAPDKIQQRIKNKVEEAHQKREQSKQLLEIAKTGVEKAIEENEELAINWIEKELQKLNVSINQ
ncbi:type I restriction-modification system methyltransferase subunit [Synechococcus sp. PCC 7502]|uniref:N-6 DNA methylase n=1 Tax=Synechococcus sp. PCC 7502 TaxID=1173263 RepID=UPI00029F9436|nr:N-6 DNA methylase [Synechococcus sp. PCC 7502]AFY73094.1 type I restriction-modification system methyltransferase subunit [Synechococcus sp. PCC 7502]